MGILKELNRDETWEAFLQYKITKRHFSDCEQKEWTDFIRNREYKEITSRLQQSAYSFDLPVKRVVNKKGTKKKRIVYSFQKAEAKVLKVMAYLLYKYDDKINPNCYSFRRNKSAKSAIHKIVRIPRIDKMYCFKADISNYFNSIPAQKLNLMVRNIIDDDKELTDFLESLILAGGAYENDQIVYENRGAMAGIPISPFFANIYLLELDAYFERQGALYFRYSDDILIFASDEMQLQEYRAYVEDYLKENGLALNPDKEKVMLPGEKIEFLGVCYSEGKIDLSQITKEKLKAKIRRKAHALYHWRTMKGVDFEKTARVMIRIFNKKFYDDCEDHSFTWSRWFFPILTSEEGLKEIDACLVSYIRYIYSGRHYKGNYRIKYETIKELGYRSLVNEYYSFRESMAKSSP